MLWCVKMLELCLFPLGKATAINAVVTFQLYLVGIITAAGLAVDCKNSSYNLDLNGIKLQHQLISKSSILWGLKRNSFSWSLFVFLRVF